MHPERTLILVKPDGIKRGLLGEVISRFEHRGFTLVDMKLVVPSTQIAELHYIEHAHREFYGRKVDFLASGKVAVMIWEGIDVISVSRTMIGDITPSAALPGTIRGDLAYDILHNVVHGSNSAESSEIERRLWFGSSLSVPPLEDRAAVGSDYPVPPKT